MSCKKSFAHYIVRKTVQILKITGVLTRNVYTGNYGVDAIFGIRDGYRGFFDPAYEKKSWTPIGPDDVEDVHRRGGTFLGTV